MAAPLGPLITVQGCVHCVPSQLQIEIVGTVPPLASPYSISLSPICRSGVTYTGVALAFALLAQVAAVPRQACWFSSKSIAIVPVGLLTRVQNSSRNLPPGPFSTLTPKFDRSLLFGGIEPETMVGAGVFSFVPIPNESSPLPLGRSAFVTTLGMKTFDVPAVSQSMQGAPPSTVRFASVSISKLLPVNVFAVGQVAAAARLAFCCFALVAPDPAPNTTANTTAAVSVVASNHQRRTGR